MNIRERVEQFIFNKKRTLYVATAAYDWRGTSVIGVSFTSRGAVDLIKAYMDECDNADDYYVEKHIVGSVCEATVLNGRRVELATLIS